MTPEARLAALPIWPGRPEISFVPAGRTNRNYLVVSQGRRYFARIGNDIPAHGISRAAELRCAGTAARAQLAPDVLYAENGIMVSAFVAGETLTLDTARQDRTLTEVAQLLRRLHAIAPPPEVAGFSLIAAARRYLAALPESALPRPRERVAAALAALNEPPPNCLVHGDLIPDNIIRSPEGLRLIDWEYAGGGVPETDLALAISNFDLDSAQAERFIAAYGAADLALIDDLRIAAIIREALWCLAQARLGGNVGDLPHYTAICLDRLDRVLA